MVRTEKGEFNVNFADLEKDLAAGTQHKEHFARKLYWVEVLFEDSWQRVEGDLNLGFDGKRTAMREAKRLSEKYDVSTRVITSENQGENATMWCREAKDEKAS